MELTTDGARRRLPRAERREQIVLAAATAFAAGGFDGTSVDDVAKAAGVTRLIVYRIFESKDQLYRAVLDAVVGDLIEEFRDRDGEPLGIAELLLRVARRNPDGFRLLWRQAAHEREFAELAAAFRSLVHGYADSLLRAHFTDDLIRHWAAESLVAHLYESICLWLDHGDPDRDDEFVHLLAQGNRAMVEQWTTIVSRPS